MAGRKRLVEANAKTALGETSAALIAPGIAGALIQMLTAPFAIVVDAVAFFISALLLRRVEGRNDVPHPGVRAGVWREIGEGLKLVARNRTLLALAWLAGMWQFLHQMQIAVLILFATRELSLSAGAIGFAYAMGGLGCVLASALAQRLSARYGVGPMLVNGLIMTAIGWQAFGLIGGPPWIARRAGVAMPGIDFGAIQWAINYFLASAAGDHAGPPARPHDGDDALFRRGIGAPWCAGRRRTGDRYRPACDLDYGRRAGRRVVGGRGALVAGAPSSPADSARARIIGVIPAKAGIQYVVQSKGDWAPAYAGATNLRRPRLISSRRRPGSNLIFSD
jgi:hypothetical protein